MPWDEQLSPPGCCPLCPRLLAQSACKPSCVTCCVPTRMLPSLPHPNHSEYLLYAGSELQQVKGGSWSRKMPVSPAQPGLARP